jgi:ribosomal protein S14
VPVRSVAATSSSGASCPRCGRPDATARYYGPCERCVVELGETMRLVPREVAREAYVPKLNVVPNHVATKD